MKQRHQFESIVAETLLIPLYYRAKESRRKNPILNDKVAEGLVDSLEYDYSRFDGAKLSEVGCGPDTRFQRIGDGCLVEQWESRLRLLEQANYMKFFRSRWGFFFGQILGRMTRLCYTLSPMLGYEIVSE